MITYDISNISYDDNGNISGITKGGTTYNYTYNYYTGTNKLKNTGGSNNDYEYDLNGNVKKSTPKNIPTIAYDPFTQMTKNITVTGTPNKTMLFQYSADNERILKNEKQGTTNNNSVYIRGNSDYPISEKINTNNALADKIYIYGPTGLIAFKDATATYFVIKDHLGSTRVLFKSAGSQYTTYDYSSFGGLMRATINGDVVYKFTGQEYDSETGLYNFRARLYDDELGIFYAVDPAGQNFSPFSYCANNPIVYIDKDGRFFWLPLAILAAAGTYGAVKGAIEGGWQGAIYGFGSMTTAAGFAMASIGASIASGGSLGAALMNTGFQSLWTATQGKNLGEIVTSAAETFATSWLASSGHGISDWLGRGNGNLWTKLGTQAGITTTNSIINNYANNKPLFENLKVGVGPVVFNVNGSKPIDINLKDNLFEAGAHVLGGLNILTGGGIDFSWDDLSFAFSGGLYEEVVLQNPLIMKASGNSIGGVAWLTNGLSITGETAKEEFAHVWQSRFFGGNINFGISYLANYIQGRIVGYSNRDAYWYNYYEIEARTFRGR